jgi:hypothetical protein
MGNSMSNIAMGTALIAAIYVIVMLLPMENEHRKLRIIAFLSSILFATIASINIDTYRRASGKIKDDKTALSNRNFTAGVLTLSLLSILITSGIEIKSIFSPSP